MRGISKRWEDKISKSGGAEGGGGGQKGGNQDFLKKMEGETSLEDTAIRDTVTAL